ncbi:amino acid ABC transporter substrate-binding protein [Variovorax sp. M-6]|uniref:amino acid ABC transporter substrate-binding protein n=1 Tax=Variovorax sp. M-6 TaxID=3233041 RepID=UPI003F993AAB
MEKKVNRRRSLELLGGVAGAAAIASFSRSARAQPMPAITLGGTIPFSGRWAEIGQNVHSAYQTVAKYVNEVAGGLQVGNRRYRIEVKMVDDASDPQRATSLLQRQVDDGIQYFLGSYSSPIVLPMTAITERARRPMVQAGGGADAIFDQGYKFVFGIFPRASRSAFPAVDAFELLTPKPRTFIVAYTNNPFSKPQGLGVIQRLKAKGFQVLDTLELPAQLQDVSALVEAVRSKSPDIVVCLTGDQESLLIARQLAQARADVKLLFTSLGPQSASFREALGKYGEGITCISTWSPTFKFKDPIFGSTEKYVEFYRANNKLPMTYHQGTGAACMVAYAAALQKAGRVDDPIAVRDALATLDLESLYGHIKFTPEGDGDPVLMGAVVTQVQGSEVKVIHPASLKEAPAIWPMQPWSKR